MEAIGEIGLWPDLGSLISQKKSEPWFFAGVEKEIECEIQFLRVMELKKIKLKK